MNYKISLLVLLVLLIGFTGAKKKESSSVESIISIYDFENKEELKKYSELNLDRTHPNLLNPKISEKDFEAVRESWTEFHQRIGNYLSEHDFKWEIDDPEIRILHKFYFDSNGGIKSYFFRVMNKNVKREKRLKYAELISEFAKTHKIDFKKEYQFAQCGKTKYLNN